jgi:SAM-dependent methyltransferase
MGFINVYEDPDRASSYAKLEFPGTYHLAFRDLPEIIGRRARGKRALDFGCGAGRSTRFLRHLGFDVVGVDISLDMILKAREIDPAGDYRMISEGDLGQFEERSLDLVLSAFTFDNIPTEEQKVRSLAGLRALLRDEGVMVNLVSSAEIYKHEWASFSTKDFPENRTARTGDRVRIVMTDVEDTRPVEDVVWYDEDYRNTHAKAGFRMLDKFEPLAMGGEPYHWVNETRIAPWVIYVLSR